MTHIYSNTITKRRRHREKQHTGVLSSTILGVYGDASRLSFTSPLGKSSHITLENLPDVLNNLSLVPRGYSKNSKKNSLHQIPAERIWNTFLEGNDPLKWWAIDRAITVIGNVPRIHAKFPGLSFNTKQIIIVTIAHLIYEGILEV